MNISATVFAHRFEAIQLQAALFTPDLAPEAAHVDSPSVAALCEWFDGDPVVLPFPESAPREFPRLVLSSQEGERRCEVAPGRLSIFELASVSSSSDHVRPFLEDVARAFQSYREVAQARVDRMAFVITRFAPVDEPERMLADHYLKPRWSDGINPPILTFELNLHQAVTLDGRFSVNVWNRASNSLAEIQGERVRGVVFEQDVNTVVAEGSIDYTQEQIGQFYASVGQAADEMLTQFYPKGGSHD